MPEGLALASEFESLGDSGMEGYYEVRTKLVAEVSDLKDKPQLYKRRPYMMKVRSAATQVACCPSNARRNVLNNVLNNAY